MMDVQGDGMLDFEEFLAATVHVSKAASEANLFRAFAELDMDGDGLVTADEVAEKLRELGMSEVRRGQTQEASAGMAAPPRCCCAATPGL